MIPKKTILLRYSIYLISILACLSFFVTTHAQVATSTPTATSTIPTPDPAKYEQRRREILQQYGIPENISTSVLDVLYQNQKNAQSGAGKQPIVAGNPLGDLTFTLSSKNYTPGSSITLKTTTYSADNQQMLVTWYQDGKRVLSGKGKTSYTVTLGQLGTSVEVRAVVSTDSGFTKELKKVLRPAITHLVWSADTYIPAWYKGKALAVSDMDITVLAIPDFQIGSTRVNPKDLYYEWAIDNDDPNLDTSISGLGKNTYTLSLSRVQNRTSKVTVYIKDSLGRIENEQSINVVPTVPTLIHYPVDPLYGVVSWKSIRNSFLKAGEAASILVEPYFMPKKDLASIQYSWTINGTTVNSMDRKSRILNLGTSQTSSGEQSLQTSYENPLNIFERGGSKINIVVTQ